MPLVLSTYERYPNAATLAIFALRLIVVSPGPTHVPFHMLAIMVSTTN